MKMLGTSNRPCRRESGIVMAEAVLAVGIFALIVGTVLTGYVSSSRRLAWASNAAAAQAMAVTALEQAFGASWSPTGTVDEMSSLVLTQLNTVVLNGAATNFVTVTPLSTVPPLSRLITVNCVWGFRGQSYTNTVAAIRGPNY